MRWGEKGGKEIFKIMGGKEERKRGKIRMKSQGKCSDGKVKVS